MGDWRDFHYRQDTDSECYVFVSTRAKQGLVSLDVELPNNHFEPFEAWELGSALLKAALAAGFKPKPPRFNPPATSPLAERWCSCAHAPEEHASGGCKIFGCPCTWTDP